MIKTVSLGNDLISFVTCNIYSSFVISTVLLLPLSVWNTAGTGSVVGDVDIEIDAVAFENTFFFGSVSRNVGANSLFD